MSEVDLTTTLDEAAQRPALSGPAPGSEVPDLGALPIEQAAASEDGGASGRAVTEAGDRDRDNPADTPIVEQVELTGSEGEAGSADAALAPEWHATGEHPPRQVSPGPATGEPARPPIAGPEASDGAPDDGAPPIAKAEVSGAGGTPGGQDADEAEPAGPADLPVVAEAAYQELNASPDEGSSDLTPSPAGPLADNAAALEGQKTEGDSPARAAPERDEKAEGSGFRSTAAGQARIVPDDLLSALPDAEQFPGVPAPLGGRQREQDYEMPPPTRPHARDRVAPAKPRTAVARTPPRLTAQFALPESYRRWNRILVEYCLLGHGADTGPAYLSITPRVLSAALESEEDVLLSPDDAVDDFVAAVSLAYRTQVLDEPSKLWALAAPGSESEPQSVGLLALSVLAAYEMRSDEEAGPNAYYPRLGALLGCEMTAGGHPRGFEPRDFADLWDHLSHWLESRTGRRLAVPGPDVGLRRFIAYPLGHVPLRQVDVEKLPEFFDWARLEPDSRADPGRLGDALEQWAVGPGALSRSGEAALADDRRLAVVAQVSAELESWDGSWTDRRGRRTAAVHVNLDFVRRQPYLYFLARRPSSFPATFEDGTRTFEAGEPGWYDPMAIAPEDGPILRVGLHWTCSGTSGSFSLHRPPSTAIALQPSEFITGYLSQRGLLLGVQSAVLCISELEATAEEFLSTISGARCHALQHANVPQGWSLFVGITPTRDTPAPAALGSLEVQSEGRIIFRGGLRLGRRTRWMAGAPPAILISGHQGAPASLDGQAAEVANGILQPPRELAVGLHVVQAGRSRRKVEIAEPDGRWEACPPLVPDRVSPDAEPIALPPGSWTVIGATPGQVAHVTSADRGSLLAPAFQPIWAVSVGRRNANVLALSQHPQAPAAGPAATRRHPAALAWASVIYDANIRRPQFGSAGYEASLASVQQLWATYVRAARTLKRRWRRRE